MRTKHGQIPENLKNIPTRNFVDGRNKILTFEEAYKMFWTVNFAWHRLLDCFRTDDSNNKIKGNMMEIAKPSGAFFALKLSTRGSLALSITDACLMDEYGFSPTNNVFSQEAHKFARCFHGDKLFESTYICDDKGRKQLAYRIKPGKTWIIVLGVDPESGLKDEEIEWEIFKTPPAKNSNKYGK